MELGDVLITESEIAGAVDGLAARIGAGYDLSELVLVGAMDGAVCFLADLMRAFGSTVYVTTARMRRYFELISAMTPKDASVLPSSTKMISESNVCFSRTRCSFSQSGRRLSSSSKTGMTTDR